MSTKSILACGFISLAHLVGAWTISLAAEKPNIIFVLFDDMGYGQPPSYNPDSALRTPNLDKLCTQGMRFTDAHSSSGICTPTRYGLLTGRYPSRIGQFGVLTTYSPPIIPASRLTIASMLKSQGYDTAIIGKWHLGMNWIDVEDKKAEVTPIGSRMKDGPQAVGFDYFYGFTHARNIETIIEQDRVVKHVAAIENQPLMMEKTLEWLDQRKADEPFFLYFPMCPPHNPIVPAEQYIGKSGARDLVKNDKKYGDWVYQGDDMLGQIMDKLDDLKLADNTLLIAAADNGAAGRAYVPLRASKSSIYEGGHRVPFVVRWPGRVKEGSIWNETISLTDTLATLAQVTGAALPSNAGEDSFSYLPALLRQTDQSTHQGVVAQSGPGDLSIRQGHWKALFHRSGKRELFNLKDDISETNDVLSSNPKIANEMTEMFQEFIDRGRSTPGAVQKNEFRGLSLDGMASKKSKRKSQKE